MANNITGEQIYNLIKPHLNISFHGETYADDRSLENLEVIDILVDKLLTDLDDLRKQVDGRYEYSANRLEKTLMPILDNIKAYADEWEIKE